MKTYRLTALALLAALFAGCAKDDDSGSANDGRIHIFAEQMTPERGSKVLFFPDDLNAAQWVENETVNLNGYSCTIVSDGGGSFTLDLDGNDVAILGNPRKPLYALYPATMTSGGNDITVSNNLEEGCAVVLNKMTLTFRDGGHDAVFPMAARAAADGSTLLFKHLTGGIMVTLTNNTGADKTLDTLKIGALDASGKATIYRNLHPNGLSWEGGLEWTSGALPDLPNGGVGEIEGDQGTVYVGDVTLVLKTPTTSYVTLADGESLTLCVPMLAASVKTLTVTGKYGNTVVIPTHSKELTTAKAIERNKMYTIPEINITNNK